MVALLSGRYRLSRREVRQLLRDLWQVRVSLGAVVRQEQAQSAALAPAVGEARAAVHQADVVNMDETGWRQEKQRAWLWTAVTPCLTAFLLDRSRGGPAIEALLGERFTGMVEWDRWSTYGRFPAERQALCCSHLKRDFQALEEFDRKELQRRLVPLLGRLLRRGGECADHKAAALCRALNKTIGGGRRYGRLRGSRAWSRRTTWPSGCCGRPCCGAKGALARTAMPAVGLPSGC